MTVIVYQPRSTAGRFQKPEIRQPLAEQRQPDQVGPTPAWFRLRYHPEQHRLSLPGEPRFRVVPSGRRSGKTLIAKRFGVRFAFRRAAEVSWPDPRIGFGAPTYTQARKLYWADLKRLIPHELFARPPRESEMKIELVTGVEIFVVGLDSAERLEGIPWDALFMDEFANTRDGVWSEHIRPALMDRRGIAWLFGVPEGSGEYAALYERAALGQDPAWGAYHWRSEDILPPEEIASARADMDEQTYEQELGGRFLSKSGAAYYKFSRAIHAAHPLRQLYRPAEPLILAFDFNVQPGCAVIAQEMRLPNGELGTGVIGEVHIQRDSNTERVARAVANEWGHHAGEVLLYGDSTGGSRSTSALFGTDWDLIRAVLHPVFGARLRNRVETNPPEKSRVNSLNSRLMSISGVVRLMVDPRHAPELVRDFENVRLKEDGSGAIDKRPGPFTHLTDSIGYYCASRWPVGGGRVVLGTGKIRVG